MSALIDSGAEENCLDGNLAEQLQIPLVPLETPLEAHSFHGLPLAHVVKKTIPITLIIAGNDQETLSFHLT